MGMLIIYLYDISTIGPLHKHAIGHEPKVAIIKSANLYNK